MWMMRSATTSNTAVVAMVACIARLLHGAKTRWIHADRMAAHSVMVRCIHWIHAMLHALRLPGRRHAYLYMMGWDGGVHATASNHDRPAVMGLRLAFVSLRLGISSKAVRSCCATISAVLASI